MTSDLNKALHRALSPLDALSDGQLLSLFVTGRDEVAFEKLVRRHGALVLSLCLRVLRDIHDAEDAFQATFLFLARKASSVVNRDSAGGWLYRVGYRVALEARAARDRRRAREKQVDDMPHPLIEPQEIHDWRPLLDRELALLPEKYREVVVACDLEGLPRKEAARRLGLPEGTLSNRLAIARKKLAARLSRSGVGLASGALTVALAESAASAVLISSTVRAATLLAAGEAALATPAVALMKGALQTMFLQKLKVVVATAVVVLTLGVGGLAYRAGGQTAPGPKKPMTELEALQRENRLLKLNLEVVLEKVAALETELRALRGKPKLPDGDATRLKELELRRLKDLQDKTKLKELEDLRRYLDNPGPSLKDLADQADKKRRANELSKRAHADLLKQVEAALDMLREARDNAAQQKAADALEKALRSLRGKGTSPFQKK
jgi:RNA polymerase sigma factor (sigma-70 family)